MRNIPREHHSSTGEESQTTHVNGKDHVRCRAILDIQGVRNSGTDRCLANAYGFADAPPESPRTHRRQLTHSAVDYVCHELDKLLSHGTSESLRHLLQIQPACPNLDSNQALTHTKRPANVGSEHGLQLTGENVAAQQLQVQVVRADSWVDLSLKNHVHGVAA